MILINQPNAICPAYVIGKYLIIPYLEYNVIVRNRAKHFRNKNEFP